MWGAALRRPLSSNTPEFAFRMPARVLPLCLLAVLTVVGIAAATSDDRAPVEAWPHFRGTAHLTGVSASAPPAQLKELWSFEAGDAIESSPAIADGSVYVGVASGELVSLRLDTGAVRWRYKVNVGVGESSPAVAGDRVFIGDLSGVLHAVTVADGRAAWTAKTSGEIKSSPIVVGDRVLIGSYDGSLYAFSTANGAVLWTLKTENYVHGTPAVVDGIAYFAGCDETFHAVRVADGREVFTAPIGSYVGASIALDGERAYFGTFDNEVLGFDLKSRKVVWRYSDPQRHFPFYSSAALSDGMVILGGRDKQVHAIDALTGKRRWAFAARARIDSSPAIAAGRVYVGSGDGRLYVLDLKTGAKVFEFDLAGPVSASPALASGRVVVGSQDGRVVCLG